MSLWITITIPIVGSLVVAVITSFITVRLSIGQFYSQKWWEKKSETYSLISRDLSNLFFYVKEICAELEGEKELSDHRRDTLGKEYLRRMDSLKKTAAGGAYIISKEISEELEELIKNLENNSYNPQKEPLSDYYARDYKFMVTFRNNFNNLAKKDLKIN